jgi:hypothetical protein
MGKGVETEATLRRHNALLVFALLLLVFMFFYFTPSSNQTNNITGFATSSLGNLSAGVATFISCSWSNSALTVSFGSSINPGSNYTNASANYNNVGAGTHYNVTVDSLSNVIVNISMRGEDFISGSNKIAIGNVTWASNTTDVNGTNMVSTGNITALSGAFNLTTYVAFNEPIGSTAWYRFWINIPATALAGSYLGNYTQQCLQAT